MSSEIEVNVTTEVSTTHVHEVHIEEDGSTHEVHVEEQTTSVNYTGEPETHTHTTEVIEEEVITQEVMIDGEVQDVEVIIGAEATNVTKDVEVAFEFSMEEGHEDHIHEVV
mmetsp:Transcript_39449/g.37900  ORF Transcript_39449/g.37900 Transcript_39449/m.37900 type:complete len:111 (+) Transcript_39449:916-1248(+)